MREKGHTDSGFLRIREKSTLICSFYRLLAHTCCVLNCAGQWVQPLSRAKSLWLGSLHLIGQRTHKPEIWFMKSQRNFSSDNEEPCLLMFPHSKYFWVILSHILDDTGKLTPSHICNRSKNHWSLTAGNSAQGANRSWDVWFLHCDNLTYRKRPSSSQNA